MKEEKKTFYWIVEAIHKGRIVVHQEFRDPGQASDTYYNLASKDDYDTVSLQSNYKKAKVV